MPDDRSLPEARLEAGRHAHGQFIDTFWQKHGDEIHGKMVELGLTPKNHSKNASWTNYQQLLVDNDMDPGLEGGDSLINSGAPDRLEQGLLRLRERYDAHRKQESPLTAQEQVDNGIKAPQDSPDIEGLEATQSVEPRNSTTQTMSPKMEAVRKAMGK